MIIFEMIFDPKRISTQEDFQNVGFFIFYHKNDYRLIALISALFVIITFLDSIIIFGTGGNASQNFKNLKVLIVNQDNGELGNIAIQVIQNTTFFGWEFDNMGLNSVIEKIKNADFWAGLYIPPNFSSMITKNLNQDIHIPGNIIFVYDEGRRPYTIQFIINSMQPYFYNISNAITKYIIRSNLNISRYDNLIGIVNREDINIFPVASLSLDSSLGLIYNTLFIVITTFNSALFTIYRPFEDFPNYKGVLLRLLPTHVVCIGFGIASSVGLMIFMPYIYYGFLILILFTILVLFAYISVSHFAFEVFGPIGVLLIIFFIPLSTASSGSQLPLEVLPPFYLIGKALPYYNALKGARCIVYGSNCEMEIIIPILLSWWFGLTIIAEIWTSLTKKVSSKLQFS